MKIYSIFISLIVISILSINCKNHDDDLISINKETTIPFTLTPNNNIVVKSIINSIDTVNLMFHTAINGISIIEEVIQKVPSISFNDTSNVSSWGGSSTSKLSQNNIFSIGDMTWNDITIWLSKRSGRNTDGKFGYNFFEDKVLKIDFDKNQLCLYDSLPELDNVYQKTKLKIENGSMFIQGTINYGSVIYPELAKKWFLIHSGYSGTILLDDDFVKQHGLNTKLSVISESELQDSYGNILKTKKVKIESLSFDDIIFKKLGVGIFEGAISNQKMSVLGGDLLKRFIIYIDYKNQNLYFKKSKFFDDTFSS